MIEHFQHLPSFTDMFLSCGEHSFTSAILTNWTFFVFVEYNFFHIDLWLVITHIMYITTLFLFFPSLYHACVLGQSELFPSLHTSKPKSISHMIVDVVSLPSWIDHWENCANLSWGHFKQHIHTSSFVIDINLPEILINL